MRTITVYNYFLETSNHEHVCHVCEPLPWGLRALRVFSFFYICTPATYVQMCAYCFHLFVLQQRTNVCTVQDSRIPVFTGYKVHIRHRVACKVVVFIDVRLASIFTVKHKHLSGLWSKRFRTSHPMLLRGQHLTRHKWFGTRCIFKMWQFKCFAIAGSVNSSSGFLRSIVCESFSNDDAMRIINAVNVVEVVTSFFWNQILPVVATIDTFPQLGGINGKILIQWWWCWWCGQWCTRRSAVYFELRCQLTLNDVGSWPIASCIINDVFRWRHRVSASCFVFQGDTVAGVIFPAIVGNARTRWSCHDHSPIWTGFHILTSNWYSGRWMKVETVRGVPWCELCNKRDTLSQAWISNDLVVILGTYRYTKYLDIDVFSARGGDSGDNRKRGCLVDRCPRWSSIFSPNYLWVRRSTSFAGPAKGIIFKGHANRDF